MNEEANRPPDVAGESRFERDRDRLEYSPPVPEHPLPPVAGEEDVAQIKHDGDRRMTN